MVKDEDIYPVDTIVRLRKTGEFCKITKQCFLRPELNKFFMHYLGEIENRKGYYVIYHEEVDLEALPKDLDNGFGVL